MSSARSASFWAVAGGAGTRGLSFLAFLVIARQLSPSQMGVMAIGLAFGMFLDAFNELGLPEQVVRHADESSRFLSTVFWLQIGASVLSAGVLMAGAWWLTERYHEPQLPWVLGGICLACVLTAASQVPLALLKRRMAFKEIALRNTLATVLGSIMGLWLAYAGRGVMALLAMHVVNAGTGAVTAWLTARWHPTASVDTQTIKPVMDQAAHTLGTRMVETFTSRVDQLLIGSFFGTAVLGLYALAMRFYDVIFQSVCSPLASVLFSHLSQVNTDMPVVRQRYLSSLRNISLVGPAMFMMGALFLPEVLVWFAGDKWAPVTPFVWLILGMGAVLAVTFSHTPVFAAIGKPQVNFAVSLLSTCLWLVSLLFLPTLGAIFAAILWVGRMGLGIPLQWLGLARLVGLNWRDYMVQLMPMLCSLALMVAVGLSMHGLGWMDHRDAPGHLVAGMTLCGAIAAYTALRHSDVGRELLARWKG